MKNEIRDSTGNILRPGMYGYEEALGNKSTEVQTQPADRPRFKMLNGLCVPVSTPNNYFKTSAKHWLEHHRNLTEAGRSIQRSNVERHLASIEYDANDNEFPSILQSDENKRRLSH